MHLRTMRRKVLFALVLLLLVGGLLGYRSLSTFADLRTPLVLQSKEPEKLEKKGRAILQKMAEVHGLAIWKEVLKKRWPLEVVAVDDWNAVFYAHWMGWWKKPVQRLRHIMLPGTFTSQVELLDGPEKGLVFGLQNWRTYKKDKGKVILEKKALRTSFYLPAMQYFTEFPFRILSAGIVRYGGKSTFGGKVYHRVFATWGNEKPSKKYDQYDLWIDAKTWRMASCLYTVREAFPSATGTIFFKDYRRVGGLLLSFDQWVMLESHKNFKDVPTSGWFHRWIIQKAKLNKAVLNKLLVLQTHKPSNKKPE